MHSSTIIALASVLATGIVHALPQAGVRGDRYARAAENVNIPVEKRGEWDYEPTPHYYPPAADSANIPVEKRGEWDYEPTPHYYPPAADSANIPVEKRGEWDYEPTSHYYCSKTPNTSLRFT
ncbi:unnamed protein product [Zymoseptoria tritici ST99CH_3D7]|uniref:Uncharacterized protein n=1 Tax=Zymoseptoria tritici (strain ST99CH_3D7) TaxID=1276538 RepID=A0A1X7RN44_ZYMT9|nr:unnamed protein product [Zymoseptoria tritici ST99CH_3D7]